MGLKADLEDEVYKIVRSHWKSREGAKVPEPEEIQLDGNHAVTLEATVLYADISESTSMVNRYPVDFCAEVYKSYLKCAAILIREFNGVITAYDGDRVMAVFFEGTKNTNAATCALKLNYAVREIIVPRIRSFYESRSDFDLRHVVGIDTSKLFIARTGVRGSNDLVWVGRAANYAAKLTSMSHVYPSRITADVYVCLLDSAKFDGNGHDMWTAEWSAELGMQTYRSSYLWGMA